MCVCVCNVRALNAPPSSPCAPPPFAATPLPKQPTVGEACLKYHRLPLKPWGLYLTLDDRGRVLDRLRALPRQDVALAVVTDGERILGLGDLGANGMGISEGKVALYTVAAGVDPARCLPVCLDVGTNNAALLADPEYKGLRRRRPPREEFDDFVEEVMAAFAAWRPHALVQFEDFGNANAFRLLERYRSRMCVFNDGEQQQQQQCARARERERERGPRARSGCVVVCVWGGHCRKRAQHA